ncbi:hypothetical protein MWH25_01305 [Natroniella acetigena]|uniref:hypothetical protein n=1 Tax=Natroniella acetigena TaxID=52004 RepID=UPI00200AE2A5|nr:hypothetical protein [Natroniella acetigena]MCK8826384.1 hypothetical protein [Natroniella acetigena]
MILETFIDNMAEKVECPVSGKVVHVFSCDLLQKIEGHGYDEVPEDMTGKGCRWSHYPRGPRCKNLKWQEEDKLKCDPPLEELQQKLF